MTFPALRPQPESRRRVEQPRRPRRGQRLRQRFLKTGLAGFDDHEAVELLLTLASPAAGAEQAARDLLRHFGHLRGILDASASELQAAGLGETTAAALRIIRETANLYLRQTAEGVNVLLEPEEISNFWRMRIGPLRYEVFAVAYLDSGYRLLPDGVEILQEGTTDRVAVYPRRVVEAALRNGATALALAHNHPNGAVEPTEQDKVITRAIVLAADTISLRVADHLIVSPCENPFSFKMDISLKHFQ